MINPSLELKHLKLNIAGFIKDRRHIGFATGHGEKKKLCVATICGTGVFQVLNIKKPPYL